jgi:uncharacterized protein (DUF1800 family)
MPQVSEYDRLNPSSSFHGASASPPRYDKADHGHAVSKRARNIGWRIAVGLVVVAIWLAATVNATAATITMSASASATAAQRWNIVIDYAASGTGNAPLRLYVNGKRTDVLATTSGRHTLRDRPDGAYALSIRTMAASSATHAVSNTVELKLGATTPVVVSASKRDAARLLMQATFGPKSMEDIAGVESVGAQAWLEAQWTKPWQSHNTYLERIRLAGEEVKEEHVYESIWQNLIWGDARLRARVALALSEIMVISNIAPDQKNEALISWMDMLYRNAFGSYRTLLQEVTLHPAMGYYLNMLGNDKEDVSTGRMPNENYAREVLQLFSIGLVQLNADGTPRRDGQGQTIASYDQSIVQGFAAAFTGWNFAGNDTSKSDTFDHPNESWAQFMRAWPSRHSAGSKKLLGGLTLPAGQSPEKDLADALDNIANHANVAPFMSKRLIQFLVTSNPTAGYIGRISAVWNNNGQGVRGDLKSVVRAILLDPEARSVDPDSVRDGKVREPMVKFVHFVNAMQGRSKNGRNSIWWLDSPDDYLGQSPLLAPSVFNFFSPFFTKAGAIAQAGLVAPEMQMVTDTQIVGSANFFTRMVNDHGVGFNNEYAVDFDVTSWDALGGDANALVDRINWVWFAGAMSGETRDVLLRAINKIDASQRHERVDLALKLAVIAPEFSVQR